MGIFFSLAIISKLGAKTKNEMETSLDSITLGQNNTNVEICELEFKCPERSWKR